MLYKITVRTNKKWFPKPIYIGRTIQGNKRISQHKTLIRHTLDVMRDEQKYSVSDRIFNAASLLSEGIFRFRAGGDFKMGIALLMEGATIHNVNRNEIENYLYFDWIGQDGKKDINGVSLNEYIEIESHDSQRLGFNGVASYEFESGEDLIYGEVYNMEYIINCKNLFNQSVWFNNYGFSSLLELEDYLFFVPHILVQNILMIREVLGSVTKTFDKLYKKLKSYNGRFYKELSNFTELIDIEFIDSRINNIRKKWTQVESDFIKNKDELVKLLGDHQKIYSKKIEVDDAELAKKYNESLDGIKNKIRSKLID